MPKLRRTALLAIPMWCFSARTCELTQALMPQCCVRSALGFMRGFSHAVADGCRWVIASPGVGYMSAAPRTASVRRRLRPHRLLPERTPSPCSPVRMQRPMKIRLRVIDTALVQALTVQAVELLDPRSGGDGCPPGSHSLRALCGRPGGCNAYLPPLPPTTPLPGGGSDDV